MVCQEDTALGNIHRVEYALVERREMRMEAPVVLAFSGRFETKLFHRLSTYSRPASSQPPFVDLNLIHMDARRNERTIHSSLNDFTAYVRR